MTVSIDVDAIDCYYKIHGLGPAPRALEDRILAAALPRFAELLEAHDIRATFFVVAKNVEDATSSNASLVSSLVAAGHLIGNHSYSHPYDLARRDPEETSTEIQRAHDILSNLAGKAIVGFRAPGYDLSVAMLRVLEDQGYLYDSSIFPAPGYYAAKAVVMGALRFLQRPSGAVMTNPRAMLASPDPYRMKSQAPWRRGRSPVIELPIAVVPWTRTPAIGTNLLLAPSFLRRHWIRAMARRSHFNFELHAIDLCDAEQDRLPADLVRRQPDLRRSLSEKAAAFQDILSYAKSLFDMSTLEDVARGYTD